MLKKTKLKASWEQSFQGFKELSPSSSLTFASHSSSKSLQWESQFGVTAAPVDVDGDSEITIDSYNDEQDETKVSPVYVKQAQPLVGAKACHKSKGDMTFHHNSPDIDSFIHKMLTDTSRQDQPDSQGNVPEEHITSSHPASIASTPNSVRALLQEVLADSPVSSPKRENDLELALPCTEKLLSPVRSVLMDSTHPTLINSRHKSVTSHPESPSLFTDITNIPDSSAHDGYSQIIDHTQEGCVCSLPPSPTCNASQPIFSCHSHSDGDLDSTIPSFTSSFQTPELSNKLAEFVKDGKSEKGVELDLGISKKLNKGGMAEHLQQIIRREESEYSICRYQLTVNSDRDSATPVTTKQMKLVVTETSPTNNAIHTVVVCCDTIEPGTQAFLLASRLSRENNSLPRHSEITVHWPWSVYESNSLGTIIFASSVCDVSKSISQSKTSPRSETRVTIIGRQCCQCVSKGRCNNHPIYTGPYAFLHQ